MSVINIPSAGYIEFTTFFAVEYNSSPLSLSYASPAVSETIPKVVTKAVGFFFFKSDNTRGFTFDKSSLYSSKSSITLFVPASTLKYFFALASHFSSTIEPDLESQ